jgi:hypothetical protein
MGPAWPAQNCRSAHFEWALDLFRSIAPTACRGKPGASPAVAVEARFPLGLPGLPQRDQQLVGYPIRTREHGPPSGSPRREQRLTPPAVPKSRLPPGQARTESESQAAAAGSPPVVAPPGQARRKRTQRVFSRGSGVGK